VELNEQEKFWAHGYAREYIEKNKNFDAELGVEAWETMLKKASGIQTILECGCNIGRQINFLNKVLPQAEKSVIEISKPAFDFVTSNYNIKSAFNGSIVESNFNNNSFDLTFVFGVLIHIHPDNLLANMSKLYNYSKKYILIAEYFNRIPVMIEYQGQLNKLFKRDFGRLFLENFGVKIVDFGFLWEPVYGFDDITWWLFEKK
jgi:pseudaminic acid biosynthesis-associated methylase